MHSYENCRVQTEVVTETVAEISAAAEATVGSYLHNVLVGLFDQQLGCIIQTQLLDVAGQLGVVAALGENGTHALLRQPPCAKRRSPMASAESRRIPVGPPSRESSCSSIRLMP